MLKVHLEPAQATATPGTGLIVTVVVTNDGDAERTCRIRVVGLEAPWIEHSDGDLTVPAGSRLEIPIRVTLPFGFPRGETLVGFEVQADGDERPMVVDTRLSVSDLESLNIGLSPVTVRGGWRGRFRLNIENRGKDPLTIKLSGRGVGPDETKSDLDFTFKPENLTLRPGERVKTRGFVTGKRHIFGNPRRRALTVTAQGETAPRHVQGAFVQRPLMPRNILRVVGLVIVLAMWAGGLTAGVRLTSGKGKASSAQDASANVDPGALGGPAGTDGTAGGGTNGTGSESAVVPAAGGAIAGQVKGPTDASGITVKLRPVALADDLSTDLAAQTVSFVSSSTEDAPKESAQTLRREPSGPVGPTAATTTDAEGRWAFGGLKTPANYEVTFSKAGFAERTYVISVDDQTPTVALEVPMVPGNGALSGTVKGPDGPLGGAVVTVTDGTVTFRATTPDSGDDAGKWSIDGLTTPATYMVSASLRGYGTESTSLSLDSGGSKDGVDLTMVAGVGSISGHISGGGAKLGNITVTATNGDVTRSASTLTEGDAGAFSLPQLPIPGDYTISVAGAGWIPQTMALALKGNASKVDLDLVKTTATIIGTVKDATGKALASTGVTLAADKPIVKTLSAIDPAGTYELSGLAPGTYTLSFDRADFKTESTIVTVASGDRKSVDMTLTAQTGDKIPKDAVVRGIVRSSTTGNPIAGVQVSTGEVSATSTATATATTTATSDATGAFVLDKLAPGSYDLKFTSGHYQPLTRTLRIGAKSDTTIDVTMLILGGVQGLVTDLTATPITNVTVTVTNDPAAIGQPGFTATTTTNTSGQYSLLEQLPTGKYIATFARAGYATRSRNFEAAAGTVAVGDIQLIELGRIHGTIQTADSGTTGGFAALNGVHLLVEVQNGSAWSTVQDLPSVNGEYMITDLQPGDYRVTADKAGFGSSTKLISALQLREERDGGLILTPGAQTVTGRVTFQDGAVLSPVVGAAVSTSAVVGFDTLTVFPFLRPRTATLSTTTNSSGDWTLSGQLAGTSSTYAISKTGFTAVTESLSPPISAGSADVTMVPNPRNLTGTLALIGAANAAAELPGASINIAGGAVNATVHPDSSGNYSFADIPVRSAYTLTVSATGYSNTVTVIAVPSGDHAIVVPLAAVTLTKFSSFTPHVKTGAGVDLPGVDITVGSGTPVATGSSGQHAYTQQLPGTYTLTFHLAGYYDVTRTFTLAAGVDLTDSTTAALAVTMLRLPAISVKVNGKLGASTTPLTSATVTAQVIVSGVPGATSTATATSSTYKLSGLDIGIYRVTITAAGYDTQVLPDITLAADDDNVANVTTPIDLLQWSPLKLHLQSRFGTTTDLDGVASNVHAIRTNLPGVTATPTNQANEPTINFSGSGGGLYSSTTNVEPGTYLITVNPTTHVTGTVSASVVAGTASSQVDLTIQQKPRITITTQTHLGASTTALNTAIVTVTGPGGTATVTHGIGTNTYVANGLSSGTYTITVAATDHDTQTFNSIAIADGDDYTNTVTLQRWSPLKLHLQSRFGTTTDLDGVATNVHAVRTNLPSGAVVPDPSAEPIINFSGSGSGLYTSTANAMPGTYDITANPSTHVGATATATVVAGTASSQVDLTIQQKPRITITTQTHLGASTTNLNTATVTVTGPGGTATVTHTGGTNTYVADSLSSGTYTITVAATDHDTQTFNNVAIADGDNYTDTVTLQKWAPISIHVQGILGGTTTDLTSVSANVNATAGGSTLTFHGGTNGVYTSDNAAPPGTYTITVDPTNYVADTVPLVVVTSGTTTSQASLVVKHLPQVTITTRTKLGSTTSALNAATVTITGPGVAATLTRSGNVHTALNLPVGTYDITATADDGLHDPQTFLSVSLAAGQSYTDTADLLEWTAFTVRLRGFNGTLSDLTSNAGDLGAVRVLDAQGNGGLTGQPPITFASAATPNTNGVYTSTTKVRPGTYTITGTPTNYDQNTVDISVVAGTTPTQALLIVQKSPALTVTVNSLLGSTSNPLTTATVTVQKLNTNGTCCSGTTPSPIPPTSSGGGDYNFNNLSSGRYKVVVTEINHVGQTFTGNSGATQGVVVSSGSATSFTVDLLQHPPLTLSLLGRNGASSPFDTTSALPGATATMTATSGGTTTTLTDQGGGTYSKAHLVPGTYTLTVTAPGYAAMTAQTGIVIAAGVTHADLAGTLTATPGSITGRVVESINSTGLSGVTVTANFSGTPGRTATTDLNGNYTITGLEPTTWSVTYSKATYSPLNQSVAVTAATASNAIDVVLVQLGEQISGTVNGYATNPGTVASPTLNPKVALPGALVTISRPGYTATRLTASDGTYTFADIPATSGSNDYTIAFTHDKYVTRSVAKTTSVASSSTREDNLIAHSGTATVTVKDLESGATPGFVASASIRLSGDHLPGPLTLTSAADGTVAFSSVPPGDYTVSLVTPPSGYLASATTVALTMGLSSGIVDTTLLGSGTATANYPISKAVSLDVTVAGLVNSDTASVTVSWTGGSSNKPSIGNTTTTFTDLPPGKAFTVTATRAHYTDGTGSSPAVTLGATGTATTATMVPDLATVQVTVTGLLGIDTTTVIIDGHTSSTAVANNGTYTFTTLITPGVSLPVTFGNANYTSTTSNIGPLDAGGTYTAGTAFPVTVSPKNGSVAVTISGLLYGEKATLTVTGANPQVLNNLTNGVTTVSNLTAGVANTFTLTATNYTNPIGTAVTLDANENTPARPLSITLTRETGTLDVTSTNLGTDTATITVTWPTGGTTSVSGILNNAVTHFTVPSGVTLTITSSATGTHGSPTDTATVTVGGTTPTTLNFT